MEADFETKPHSFNLDCCETKRAMLWRVKRRANTLGEFLAQVQSSEQERQHRDYQIILAQLGEIQHAN